MTTTLRWQAGYGTWRTNGSWGGSTFEFLSASFDIES
jgi:hypothetical protein